LEQLTNKLYKFSKSQCLFANLFTFQQWLLILYFSLYFPDFHSLQQHSVANKKHYKKGSSGCQNVKT